MTTMRRAERDNTVRPTRACRYMARVEAHLPALANNHARRAFIVNEMSKWEERFARFVATEGSSHRHGDSPDQPSAFDFVETIAALGALRGRYAAPATRS